MNITYHNTVVTGVIDVKINGRRVGRIVKVEGGWQYRTNGTFKHPESHGEVLPTIEAVKQSLEEK